MTNVYVVTAKGFYAGWDYGWDYGENPLETSWKKRIKWTDVLRHATPVKSKFARELIEKEKLEAFIWKPFAEEQPSEKRYKVEFVHDWDDECRYWDVVKMYEKSSDIGFLRNGCKDSMQGMTHEEAMKLAKSKNAVHIAELKRRNEEMSKRYNELYGSNSNDNDSDRKNDPA